MNYLDGLDPAILNALRAHQRQFAQHYPNFEGPLPAPGGPVDTQLATHSVAPDGGYHFSTRSFGPPTVAGVSPAAMASLAHMKQQFPHLGAARADRQPPQAAKFQAILQARMLAQNAANALGHVRRVNGPYG